MLSKTAEVMHSALLRTAWFVWYGAVQELKNEVHAVRIHHRIVMKLLILSSWQHHVTIGLRAWQSMMRIKSTDLEITNKM